MLADGLAAGLAAELSSTFTAWSEESAPAGSTSPPVVGDLPSDAVTVPNVPDQGMSAGRVPHAQTDLTLLDELTSGGVLLGAGRLPTRREPAYGSALRTAPRCRPPAAGAAGHGGSGLRGGRAGGPRRDDGVVRACDRGRAGDAVGGVAPAASRPRLRGVGRPSKSSTPHRTDAQRGRARAAESPSRVDAWRRPDRRRSGNATDGMLDGGHAASSSWVGSRGCSRPTSTSMSRLTRRGPDRTSPARVMTGARGSSRPVDDSAHGRGRAVPRPSDRLAGRLPAARARGRAALPCPGQRPRSRRCRSAPPVRR